MTAEKINQYAAARPFRPFVIVMSSGKEYRIDHPEMVLVSRPSLFLATGGFEGGIAEDAVMVNYGHITAVELIPGQAA
jgi:hypothetical protein